MRCGWQWRRRQFRGAPVIDYRAIGEAGVAALRRGDAAAARSAFLSLQQAGRDSHQTRLLLAQSCAALGDDATAQAALDQVLAEEPGNLYALIMRGDLLLRGGDARAAASWYKAAVQHAPRLGQLPPDLVAALNRVEATLTRLGAEFQAHVDGVLAAAGIAAAGAGPRFAEALDLLAGRAEVQPQQPTSFFYPRLPAIPFFERVAFDWVPALEAAAPAIRAELKAALADDAALSPYVRAEENRPAKRHALLDDPRWSALHLLRGGVPVTDNAVRFPATMAALAALPLPRIPGRAPNVLFSVLQAGTHIPPHHGLLNTRLICHLPLIVPPGCRLRVGNETRPVEADRVMLFDDSIEHEAWNDGTSTRVVLLFEIWRPELDETERCALTALFGAIGAYAPADQAGA